MLPDLTIRNRRPELMDGPDIDVDAFVGSLRGLRRINRFTFAGRLLWPYLLRAALAVKERPLRVLDVGSGAGDGPIALARRAQRAGVAMSFHGTDVSPSAVEFGRRAAELAGVEVTFSRMDAVQSALPTDYDVVICSLFLHHLPRDEAVAFLRRTCEAAKVGVIVQDLERSVPGFWLAYFGVRILSRSHVVHVDGPRSVEGAFTVAEARALADEAGMVGHCVRRHFPFRYVLSWMRP